MAQSITQKENHIFCLVFIRYFLQLFFDRLLSLSKPIFAGIFIFVDLLLKLWKVLVIITIRKPMNFIICNTPQ